MSSRFGRRRTGVMPSPIFAALVALTIVGGVVAWQADTAGTQAKFGAFVLVVGGWIVSMCLHEFGHAYTAWRAGDTEVALRGYLTLNPIRYSHPLLSIGLPIFFIALGGFALPGGAVYIRSGGFSVRTRRMIHAAGPAANAVLAVVLLAVLASVGSARTHAVFWFALSFLAFLQVTAVVLNLLPIPGTDGYSLLEPSLSPETRRRLDQVRPYGILLLLAILWVPQLNRLFFDVVYAIFEWSGVPRSWAGAGNDLVRFWM